MAVMNRDFRAMQIYERASLLAEPQLSEFLNQACAGDPELRSYVDSLLATEEQAADFLVQKAVPSALAMPSSAGNSPSDSSYSVVKLPFVEGTVLNQRYQISKKIGEGGMGSVYRARDLRLERDVAIKVLNHAACADAAMQRRFEREIKSVASLSHPHIVTLYDIAAHEGVPLAVMEFVAGKTLREIATNQVSIRMLLKIASDVASGLQAAHECGVMHRDIKPDNIIVASNGTAKVLDFGLARPEEPSAVQSLTTAHQAPGTPPYMSPEQVLAKEVGCATDIFSLGTLIFEMLAGQNPFRAGSALETMQRISQQAVPDITDFVDDLPAELVTLLTEMLQLRSEKRPLARQVKDRLREILLLPDMDGRLGSVGVVGPVSTLVQNDWVTPPTIEPPTNLPLRSPRLTGRNQELADIKRQLAGHSLVTVVGTGGVGKTSVAYEAARRVRSRFPGGVWLCELAPLRDQSGVLEVLAGVLDGNAGAINKFEQVVERLQGTPTLLILDNCEHVVDVVAELVERLSQQLPSLSILATSREPLKVSGERVLRLEGLPHADAAALFTQRAADYAGFQEDSRYEDLVKQVVEQLEGLPLAIELAAPKLAAMSLSELLEALDDQTATLQSGRRSQDRQSTINAAIAWSFDLLLPEEQRLLLALSVFTAWFTAKAATEVSGSGPVGKTQLIRLVEQSVVVRREDRGKSRYRLLEPIRQFCQSRLSQDERSSAQERHAYFYARRAEVLGRGVSGYDEIDCLHALNAEWPDLREAIAWGRQQKIAQLVVDPIVALARTAMWHLRLEVFQWLMAAEHQLKDVIVDRADANVVLAKGYWLTGNLGEADSYVERADNLAITPLTVWTKILIRGARAEFLEAAELWEQFEQLAEASGDEVERRWAGCAYSAFVLTMIDPSDPRIDERRAATAQCLSRLDWPTGQALLCAVAAQIAMLRGERAEALQHRDRAIEIARKCGNRFIEIFTRSSIIDTDHDSMSERWQQLSISVATLQSLLDSHGQLYVPMTVRSIILNMIAMEERETAVRCSAIVCSLQGLGDNDEYSSDYQPALENLRSELGAARFDQLREEGQSLTIEDIVGLANNILDGTS